MKHYYIGLDIGGTKCAACVGLVQSGKIEILQREQTPTTTNPTATLDKLMPFVKEWMRSYPIERCGISCGGPLDSQNGVILNPPNLVGWHGFCIADYVCAELGLCARLQNDANACAVAEWRFGAGVGTDNMVFLTFGTGLGAGLILNGRLYDGANGNAGEVGHVRLVASGPVGFGKAGSFEGFCSGGGIARLAAEMAMRKKELPQCVREMGGTEQITAKELSRYARDGDKFAKSVFDKSGYMLGNGLAVLVDLLNPQLIVLGGVFMRSSDLLVPAMQRALDREALPCNLAACQIVPAKLSENVGDVAAVSVAVEQL